MSRRDDLHWQVGRLLQWGLRPQARPAQETGYQELIDRYFDDGSFRAAVRETAQGLGLEVLNASEHGLVLVPLEDSVFALRPADFRPSSSKAEDRMLDGLVQIAIATTVFPRARDLDEDPDLVRPPVTVGEIEAQLRGICDMLAEQARDEPDPEASDEERGLIEAWRVYQRRSEAMETKDARKGTRTTRRIIEHGLERLREFGCFTAIRQGGEPAWQPTRRYQIMVQELAATRLYEHIRVVLAQPAKHGGMY